MLSAKDTVFYSKKTLNLRGKLLDLTEPVVMGILNVTPDSFYDGGSYLEEKTILKRVEQILSEGGAIIDIGGYSSRPGAADVSEKEELQRLIPAIKVIVKQFPDAIISVDTFRSAVAKEAIDSGASMVNDVSGGTLDEKMFEFIKQYQVPYVLMHMRGTPQTMKSLTDYANVVVEIVDYFQKKIFILKELGIKDIIIDPGFGFAKTAEQSYELLKHLACFQCLNLPLMVGLSRKSMISKKVGGTAEDAKNGSTVLNTIALMQGANILRVHDVKETKEIITLNKSVFH